MSGQEQDLGDKAQDAGREAADSRWVDRRLAKPQKPCAVLPRRPWEGVADASAKQSTEPFSRMIGDRIIPSVRRALLLLTSQAYRSLSTLWWVAVLGRGGPTEVTFIHAQATRIDRPDPTSTTSAPPTTDWTVEQTRYEVLRGIERTASRSPA